MPCAEASDEMIVGSSGSYGASTTELVRAFFTSLKALSCVVPHSHVFTFRSNCRSGALIEAKWGMYFQSWFTMPLNLCSSTTQVGEGNLVIASILRGSGLINLSSIMCPRNLIDILLNSHLLFKVRPASRMRVSTSFRRESCRPVYCHGSRCHPCGK